MRSRAPRAAFDFYPADRLPLKADVAGARFCEVSLERSMLTYFELEPGTLFPAHTHEGEQITLVLSGHLAFEIDGEQVVVGPREAIAIPGNVRHAVRSIDPVIAVDAWSPPPARFRTPRIQGAAVVRLR